MSTEEPEDDEIPNEAIVDKLFNAHAGAEDMHEILDELNKALRVITALGVTYTVSTADTSYGEGEYKAVYIKCHMELPVKE